MMEWIRFTWNVLCAHEYTVCGAGFSRGRLIKLNKKSKTMLSMTRRSKRAQKSVVAWAAAMKIARAMKIINVFVSVYIKTMMINSFVY